MKNRTRRKIKLSRYATVLGSGEHDRAVTRSISGDKLRVAISGCTSEPVHVRVGYARSVEIVSIGGGGGGRGVSQGGNGATFVSSGGWGGYTAHAAGGRAGGSHASLDHCGADGRVDVHSMTFLAPTVVGDGRER